MTQEDKILLQLSGLVGKHVCWKAALRHAIENKYPLDVAKLSRHDCCEFGHFVHDNDIAKYLGRFLHYQDVVKLHIKFHLEMGEVAKVANSNEYEKAKQMLEQCSKFQETSSLLIRAVMALQMEASGKRY